MGAEMSPETMQAFHELLIAVAVKHGSAVSREDAEALIASGAISMHISGRAGREHPCDEPDCDIPPVACLLPLNKTGEPDAYWCPVHAQDNGFCWGCGNYWGDDEDFTSGEGLCKFCMPEEDDETALSDEADHRWLESGWA